MHVKEGEEIKINGMEAENEIFLIGGDLAAPDGRAEIAHLAEVRTLATTEESGFLRDLILL